MFEKLMISNFQSHQNAELVFHPGVNAIVGRSNSGKTAIFRAIRLLATNRPLGNHYHSNFANDKEQTKVELLLDNGINISTTRGNNAEYQIDEEYFKGFGSSVPDLVQKALNLSELNLQDQLDQHFLICSSPGEVARTINKVIRVDEVDGWVSSLTTAVNTEQSELKVLESDIIISENNLIGYDYLEELEKHVTIAEAIESRLLAKIVQHQQLTQLTQQLDIAEQSLLQISKKLLLENNILELEELQKQIDIVSEKIFELSDYIEANEKAKAAEKFVNTIEPLFSSSIEIFDEISAIITKRSVLFNVVHELSVCQSNSGVAKFNVDDVSRKMIEFLTSLGRCPTCSTKLSVAKIKEMIE